MTMMTRDDCSLMSPIFLKGAARICEDIVDAIGQTKIIKLNRLTEGVADGAEVRML